MYIHGRRREGEGATRGAGRAGPVQCVLIACCLLVLICYMFITYTRTRPSYIHAHKPTKSKLSKNSNPIYVRQVRFEETHKKNSCRSINFYIKQTTDQPCTKRKPPHRPIAFAQSSQGSSPQLPPPWLACCCDSVMVGASTFYHQEQRPYRMATLKSIEHSHRSAS